MNALEIRNLTKIVFRLYAGSSESDTAKRMYHGADWGEWCRKKHYDQACS